MSRGWRHSILGIVVDTLWASIGGPRSTPTPHEWRGRRRRVFTQPTVAIHRRRGGSFGGARSTAANCMPSATRRICRGYGGMFSERSCVAFWRRLGWGLRGPSRPFDGVTTSSDVKHVIGRMTRVVPFEIVGGWKVAAVASQPCWSFRTDRARFFNWRKCGPDYWGRMMRTSEIRIGADRTPFHRSCRFELVVALRFASTPPSIFLLLFVLLVFLILFPNSIFLFVRNFLRRIDVLFLLLVLRQGLVVMFEGHRRNVLRSEVVDELVLTVVAVLAGDSLGLEGRRRGRLVHSRRFVDIVVCWKMTNLKLFLLNCTIKLLILRKMKI